MLDSRIVRVKVTGGFACFTRPDLKVERMTYPCMTPSAARGILDSILWKPEFQWYVRRILVLNPVRFFTIKRNEINAKQGRTPIIIEDKRAQRNSVVLRDVAYIIEASIFQKQFSDRNKPENTSAGRALTPTMMVFLFGASRKGNAGEDLTWAHGSLPQSLWSRMARKSL